MASGGDKPDPDAEPGATAAGTQPEPAEPASGSPGPAGEARAASPPDQPVATPDAAAAAATAKPVANADKSAPDKPAAHTEKPVADKPTATAGDKATADKPAPDKPAAPAPKADKPDKAAASEPPEPAKPESLLPEPPPWYRTLRADPPPLMRLALGVGLVAVVVSAWWWMTRGGDELSLTFNGRTKLLEIKYFPAHDRFIDYVKLPAPGEVFGSFNALWERELPKHLFATLERVIIGVGMAGLVGISLGILAASYRGMLAALMPLVIFLRSVPMGALIPFTLMLFGTGETQKTRFIFLAVVPFVFSDTVKAVSIVPERYVETAQTLGASRLQIIRKVLIPLSLPEILTGLRFMLGLALGYIMLAEEINAEYGLGKLIFASQRQGPNEHVYLILFIIAFVALSLDFVLRTLQRAAFAWRQDL
jgi:taurine transport system permease protein